MKRAMRLTACLSVWFAAAFPLCAYAIDEKKLVDMTYAFAEDTLHWPTAEPFKLEKVNEGMTPQGFWFASYNYSGSEHVGTHLDAPHHFGQTANDGQAEAGAAKFPGCRAVRLRERPEKLRLLTG